MQRVLDEIATVRILIYFGFSFLRVVIGLKNLCHFLDQSKENQNQS